jgi:hypothetical protein
MELASPKEKKITEMSVSESGFYGNQIIRNMGGKSAGCIEIQSKGDPEKMNPIVFGPANGQIFFEAGIPVDIRGMKGSGDNTEDEITFIYKENHGKHKKKGKHNVKVTLQYKGAKNNVNAKFTGHVELGVEDDHNEDSSPKELQGVKYQNTDILQKYSSGPNPVVARGSFQDTKDGGVRYKLDIQDPETKQWKKIFDHVDYGDNNHDIKNYRGASAYCSAIRIDGHSPGFTDGGKDHVNDIMRPLYFKPISGPKNPEQKKRLSKIGYGSIRVEEIEPDNSNLKDGLDDPLSFGKKP